MHRFLSLLIAVTFLTGCATIANLQELLTIKAHSDNQDMQDEYIAQQDDNFEKLLNVIKENRLEEYTDKRSFLKNFGEPIFVKDVQKDGQNLEQWLYRYAMRYFDSEKVYIYFDQSDKLASWRYEEAPKKED